MDYLLASNMCVFHMCIFQMYDNQVLIFTSALRRAYVIIGVYPSVHLFVCEQHNSKIYLWILFKYSHIVHICLNFGNVNVTFA